VLYANQLLRKNADTFLSLEQTRTDKRFDMPYKRTFGEGSDFIDARHQNLVCGKTHPETGLIDSDISGWLLPADAGKLYELAIYSVGPILEIGTFKGLSTSILAEAVFNSGRPRRIVTVDLSPENIAETAIGMGERKTPGRENIHFYVDEGGAFVRRAADQKMVFGLAFIDHSHHFHHVVPVIAGLPKILAPGAFVLFHDYNDPRNPHEGNQRFGVYQAVDQSAGESHLEFWGIFGCCGLFRFMPKQG
jgi:predicted O-methyltransferase YrrM